MSSPANQSVVGTNPLCTPGLGFMPPQHGASLRREMESVMDLGAKLTSLSPAKRMLVKLAQLINFGRIGFVVQAGEPAAGSQFQSVRTIKIAGQNSRRPESSASDFVLKKEWVEFFTHLKHFPDGCAVEVEISHGLPFVLQVKETIAA